MKKLIAAMLMLVQICVNAQTDDKFKGFVVQGKDTLDITKGLKSYESLRFSWINKNPEKLKSIEVHFGNGQLPFTTKYHKIGKGQQLIVINLDEFLALENMDLDSPRKREAEVSRIVILCVMENSKYKSFAIPFKVAK